MGPSSRAPPDPSDTPDLAGAPEPLTGPARDRDHGQVAAGGKEGRPSMMILWLNKTAYDSVLGCAMGLGQCGVWGCGCVCDGGLGVGTR